MKFRIVNSRDGVLVVDKEFNSFEEVIQGLLDHFGVGIEVFGDSKLENEQKVIIEHA